MLPAPNKRDVLDYECPRAPQRVRLIRNVSPGGGQRVLMTNLFDEKRYPAECFAELYHQRWGIEEAFERLKHRLNLEHVSGLSQQAVAQDVAAKIVCDNLQTLVALTAHAGYRCHRKRPMSSRRRSPAGSVSVQCSSCFLGAMLLKGKHQRLQMSCDKTMTTRQLLFLHQSLSVLRRRAKAPFGLAPEFFRRHALDLQEAPVEIGDIVEADVITDVRYILVGVHQ